MSATTLTLADRAMTHLGEVVDSLTDADLDRQSPCPDWRVRDVLAHLVGTSSALTEFARTGNRELPDSLTRLQDPIRDTQQAIRDTRAALSAGSPHAEQAAGDVAIEFTTHAWDLDPTVDIPEALASDVYAFVAPLVTDELRQTFFAAEVPVATGAGASERLLAYLGRDPASGATGA